MDSNDVKLNIGCGVFKKDGYINIDNFSEYKPDILHDLEKIPYPFDDNAFQIIEADHVLEHLESPLDVMRELHRITKPGGFITIKVPHFSRGFTHPEHKCGFDISLPYFFDASFKARYTNDIVMDLVSMKLSWMAQPYLKKLVLSRPLYCFVLGINIIINFFANLSTTLCSHLWCFWVGGFEEIEYIFCVKK